MAGWWVRMAALTASTALAFLATTWISLNWSRGRFRILPSDLYWECLGALNGELLIALAVVVGGLLPWAVLGYQSMEEGDFPLGLSNGLQNVWGLVFAGSWIPAVLYLLLIDSNPEAVSILCPKAAGPFAVIPLVTFAVNAWFLIKWDRNVRAQRVARWELERERATDAH